VTSKSTVLGLRLDHDRRGWVEAEAARQGVTVRVLFERMIDDAQSGEAPSASSSAAASTSVPDVGIDSSQAVRTPGPSSVPMHVSAAAERLDPPASSASSPCVDLRAATALSGDVIRSAISVTATLMKTSVGCARWIWRNGAAQTPWYARSTWSTDN